MNTENKFSTSMEKETWIENILNSTDAISHVNPPDELFTKITQKIQQHEIVSYKTFWLVAASIAALLFMNISVISTKFKSAKDSKTAYLEATINKSNQLYQ